MFTHVGHHEIFLFAVLSFSLLCCCRKLGWEAATERLLDVGSMAADEWPSAMEQRYAYTLWRMFRSLVGERGHGRRRGEGGGREEGKGRRGEGGRRGGGEGGREGWREGREAGGGGAGIREGGGRWGRGEKEDGGGGRRSGPGTWGPVSCEVEKAGMWHVVNLCCNTALVCPLCLCLLRHVSLGPVVLLLVA